MIYVLVYIVLLGNTKYTIVEPMTDLDACKRMKTIVESSEKVLDVGCAAMILDRDKWSVYLCHGREDTSK